MLIKMSDRFIKSLKQNKNKKGIEKVLITKIKDFEHIFDLSRQKLTPVYDWDIKKIDCTSSYGAYRLILAKNINENKVVCDFYFKNQKDHISDDDKLWLKNFLLECSNNNFYLELSNLEDLV